MATSNPEPRNSFGRSTSFPVRWLWLGRAWYALRAGWRRLRISAAVTRLMGPQYRRSTDKIEIDITYLCNLHCLNCNRSVRQAREALHMPLDRVRAFVDDSIARGKRWSRIRVLGGEPTLHPEFLEIVDELRRYRAWHPACVVEVVTNGHGGRVQARLQRLPSDVWVENSKKLGPVQPSFGPFNLAPVDDPAYRHADYSNGCSIMHDCGMGLTPLGYYPCAVAGGIDRVIRRNLGRNELPDDGDGMETALRELCRLCGRFRDGHYVPKNLRPALEEEKISPTWERLYGEWHEQRRKPQ